MALSSSTVIGGRAGSGSSTNIAPGTIDGQVATRNIATAQYEPVLESGVVTCITPAIPGTYTKNAFADSVIIDVPNQSGAVTVLDSSVVRRSSIVRNGVDVYLAGERVSDSREVMYKYINDVRGTPVLSDIQISSIAGVVCKELQYNGANFIAFLGAPASFNNSNFSRVVMFDSAGTIGTIRSIAGYCMTLDQNNVYNFTGNGYMRSNAITSGIQVSLTVINSTYDPRLFFTTGTSSYNVIHESGLVYCPISSTSSTIDGIGIMDVATGLMVESTDSTNFSWSGGWMNIDATNIYVYDTATTTLYTLDKTTCEVISSGPLTIDNVTFDKRYYDMSTYPNYYYVAGDTFNQYASITGFTANIFYDTAYSNSGLTVSRGLNDMTVTTGLTLNSICRNKSGGFRKDPVANKTALDLITTDAIGTCRIAGGIAYNRDGASWNLTTPIASQTEANEGTANDVFMTPEKTTERIYITDPLIIAVITNEVNRVGDLYSGATTGIYKGQIYIDTTTGNRYEFDGTTLTRIQDLRDRVITTDTDIRVLPTTYTAENIGPGDTYTITGDIIDVTGDGVTPNPGFVTTTTYPNSNIGSREFDYVATVISGSALLYWSNGGDSPNQGSIVNGGGTITIAKATNDNDTLRIQTLAGTGVNMTGFRITAIRQIVDSVFLQPEYTTDSILSTSKFGVKNQGGTGRAWITNNQLGTYANYYNLPDKGGAGDTIAMLSDIPTVGGVYLPLAGGTLTGTLVGTSIQASVSDGFYLGDPTSDGSRKIQISGVGLAFSRRESGSRIEKSTILN